MKVPLLAAIAALLAPAAAFAAFAPGGAAYTKRITTALLAEPAPLASVVARVPYARKVAIEEVRGLWLRVSDGTATGWVFAGNLAEQKPEENHELSGLAVAASDTTATAAARPLAPAAADYADRRGLAQSRHDVEWMEQTCGAVMTAAVSAYQQEQKKGEFQ